MRITYLFDPLCGWCYGAEPALAKLAQMDRVAIELAPIGLFAGQGARPLDAQFAAYAWQNDQRIARLTGQIFSDAYRTRVLGATGDLFDSAPATLGIIAVGLAAPDREFVALKALQHARYVDGLSITDVAAVADILERAGFSEAARRVGDPDAQLLAAYRSRTEAARAEMARFGAEGVPALVVGEGARRRLHPSSALFGDIGSLKAQLQAA